MHLPEPSPALILSAVGILLLAAIVVQIRLKLNSLASPSTRLTIVESRLIHIKIELDRRDLPQVDRGELLAERAVLISSLPRLHLDDKQYRFDTLRRTARRLDRQIRRSQAKHLDVSELIARRNEIRTEIDELNSELRTLYAV